MNLFPGNASKLPSFGFVVLSRQVCCMCTQAVGLLQLFNVEMSFWGTKLGATLI